MRADPERSAAFWAAMRAEQPGFRAAVVADARMAAGRRGEGELASSGPLLLAQVLRLALVSDGFGAQVVYRAKSWARVRGIPVLPAILHRIAIAMGQMAIGDPVLIEAGVYINHGQVVIDGITRIGAGSMIGPFVSIGLVAGEFEGPTIGRGVTVGTHACILGKLTIGDGATIGSGAVVLGDVPAGAIVVGVPAREIPKSAAP